MRHVLDGIKVRVVSWDFDTAAPAAAAVKVQAARVGHSRAINHDLVVVETFVLGRRDSNPGALLAFCEGVLGAAQKLEHNALGLWRNNADADAPFRIDLRVLFSRLVKRRRLEIFHHRLTCLGQCRKASE